MEFKRERNLRLTEEEVFQLYTLILEYMKLKKNEFRQQKTYKDMGFLEFCEATRHYFDDTCEINGKIKERLTKWGWIKND